MIEHLHHYSEGLYFEIGGGADEPQELVVSAAENKEYFVEVEKLVAEAPSMFNRRCVAFKQPAEGLSPADSRSDDSIRLRHHPSSQGKN